MVCCAGMLVSAQRHWSAVITLIGTIIGVGIFGVPYAIAHVGLGLAVFYFVLLTVVQVLQHLFYAEAAIACTKPLRLVGLAGQYLGPRARHIAAFSGICGYWGGILAYAIVGGTFLHTLLSPVIGGEPVAYQIGWPLVAATFVFFGLQAVIRVNTFATFALLAAMAVIFWLGYPRVDMANFLAVPAQGFDPFLPYGVILFSLSGLAAVLEMEDVMMRRHKTYRLAVVTGTLVAAALTAAFGFIVWGVSGEGTTRDAVSGFAAVLGGPIGMVCALFGFLAVLTSYFATAITLQSIFEYDYKLSRPVAWALTTGVPLGLYMMGAKDFVRIVGFTGAVFGGITAVIVSLMYIAVTKKRAVRGGRLGVPVWVAGIVAVMLAVGAAIETYSTLFVH